MRNDGAEPTRAKGVHRLQTVLTILGLNCFSAGLLIAVSTPPARGFEISIVNAFPAYFWALPPLGTAFGVSIIILEAFASVRTRHWVSGFAIVLACNALLLVLPSLRGYASYPSGDALTHLGYTRDIIETGQVGPSNFYPVVHILGAILTATTAVSLLGLPIVLYTSWFFVYMTSIYALAKVLATNRRGKLLILAFASPLIFSNMQTVIHPSMLALFLMPLLLYAHHRRQLLKSRRVETTIILVLAAIAITFTHPVTAIFAIMVATTLIFSSRTFNRIAKRWNLRIEPIAVGGTSYRLPLVMVATFFTWYLSYSAITRSFANVYGWLVSPTANSVFAQQTSLLSLAGLSSGQTAELFLFRYGGIALFFTLSAVASVRILFNFVSSRGTDGPIGFGYALAFLLSLLVSGYSVLGFTGEFDPIRISRFFLLLAPIICGLAFNRNEAPIRIRPRKVLSRTSPDHHSKGLIAGVVFLAIGLYVAGLFSSPLTAQGNWQVTQEEISGGRWFVVHADNSFSTIPTSGSEYLRRFQNFVCGMDTCPAGMYVNFALEPMPSHFGYPGNSTISEALKSNTAYVVTDEISRVNPFVIPENVRASVHQYTVSDFDRLSADPSISEIYSNGQFEVWKLNGA